MGTQPQGAIRAGLRAARRERRGVGVAVLGRAMLMGALVAAVLIAADRLIVLHLAWWMLVAGPMMAAGLGAAAWSMRRPARAMHGAALIDESLASHDRLRNAIALGDDLDNQDDAFAHLAIEQGEAAAREADIARAAPIRFGWTWVAWPAVGAMAVLGGLLLPHRAVEGDEPAAPPVTLAERTEAIEQVEDALQAIRDAAAQEPSLEGASTQDLERLAEIESELSDGLTTPDEARAEAASTLERTAESLEEEALRRELERDAFEELTRELDAGDDAMSEELAQRLRSGDFDQASEAVRELLKQSESMSADERERLASELESLSEQLRKAAEESAAQNPPATESAPEPAPETPSEPGGDPELEQTPPDTEPGSPQERMQREQEAQERAREEAERLSDAMRRSAEQARKDPEQRQPQPGEQSPRESSPEAGEQEPGAQGEQGEQGQRETERESRDGSPREGEQGGDQPQPQPEGEPQEQSEDGSNEQEGQRPEQGEGQTPSEREAGEQGQDGERSGRQESQGQEPSDTQPGQREGGEQRPGAEPGSTPDSKPGEQGQEQSPGQRQGERPGERPGEGAPETPESLDEQLRRMGEQGRQGERQRERADELRQRARRLMGEPESEQEPGGGGPLPGEQELARSPEAPTPIEGGPTTPVDARNTPEGERPSEQVIGDWYSDEALSRDPAARREAAQRVRDAKEGAERAIEQQRVPRRRRDFLRRVYERVLDVVVTNPLWLLLALASAPMAVLAMRWFSSMGRWRRVSAIGARVVLFSLLALLLAGASSVRESKRLAVVGVVDLSGSVRRFADLGSDEQGRRIAIEDAVRAYFERALGDRGPDDLFGLVVFDAGAIGIATPSSANVLDRPFELVASDGTDIAGALRRAAAMIPPDASGRLVLISDGVQTTGDGARAARELASFARGVGGDGRATGLAVDTLALEYRVGAEVFVESIDAPPRAAGESRVTLRIVLNASAPVRGTLRVTREGQPLDLDEASDATGRRLTLATGRSVELAPVELPPGTVHRFEAVFEPDLDAQGSVIGDTTIENNRASAFTITPGQGSVLLVDGVGGASQGGAGSPLVSALRSSNIRVEVVDPSALSSDLLQLQAHDLVILQNVPAEVVDPRAQRALVAYVEDLGGGLVMVGGADSFGAGAWMGSAIEPILPVRLDLPEQLVVPEAAIVFVLDSSGSMGGSVLGSSRSQQQIANEAAAMAVETLDTRDLVGVIAFNNSARLVVPLRENTDPDATVAAIRSIGSGGGTNLGPALELAREQLSGVEAKLRHVIVLSDGRSQNEHLLPDQAARMFDDGIRVTTIAVGDGSDAATMREIADQGHGVFHNVVSATTLPQVFLKAVRIVRSPMVREEPFDVVVLPTGSPLTEGLGQPPRLNGLVLTQAREERTITYAMATPEGEPVLAHWPVGLGQVAAFTSDAHRWAERWLSWDGYVPFWTQVARLIGRAPSSSNAELSSVVQDGRLLLRVEVSDDDGAPVDMLDMPATVYGPQGDPLSVRLNQTAPGVYEGSTSARDAGSYVAVIKPRRGSERLAPVLGGASVGAGAEFRRLESDAALLESISQITGGRSLRLDAPESAALFDRSSVPVRRALTPIWPMLLAWTIAVFLLDVGTRRVAWDRFMSREFGTDLARRAREAVEDRSARASRTVSGLGEGRQRRREQPSVGPAAASLSQADALRVQQEAKRQRVRAQQERMKEIRERRRAEQEKEGSTPKPPAKPAAKPEAEDGALLGDRGVRVIAIEPNAAMREGAEAHPRVRWQHGTGEATGLGDASVDLVLCAQAYHWMDPPAACAEFARVLRPGGRLALMWNDGDESTPVAGAYYELLREVATEGTLSHKTAASGPTLAPPFETMDRLTFRNVQRMDREGLIGRAMSASYVPKNGLRMSQTLSDPHPHGSAPDRQRVEGALGALHARYRDCGEGRIADYIPELAKADPGCFAISIVTVGGDVFEVGSSDSAFTIQSLSKPFTHALALSDRGRESVMQRVGVEPSGDSFDSIIRLDASNRPHNPMVNAGAIAVTSMIEGADPENRFERILRMLGSTMGRRPEIDEAVFESEKSTGHRNRAMAHLMMNFGLLDRDVEEILDLYFRQCSVVVTARDMAMMAATLANGGVNPATGAEAIKREYIRDVLTVMHTCGMYNYAGEWAYTVGLPAKSGV
eukprot:g5707.t1